MLASHMSALSQSQLISQMGIRSSIAHGSPSPPASKSATPSPSSSTQEEESEAHFKVGGMERHCLKIPLMSKALACGDMVISSLWKSLERCLYCLLEPTEEENQQVDNCLVGRKQAWGPGHWALASVKALTTVHIGAGQGPAAQAWHLCQETLGSWAGVVYATPEEWFSLTQNNLAYIIGLAGLGLVLFFNKHT